MNCISCNIKSCRQTVSCNAQQFDNASLLAEYHQHDNQEMVQAAAQLVDNGRAGSLSRIDEIIEFSKQMNFTKIGLAYCYGMENDAAMLSRYLKEKKLKVVAVSCTVGGFSQNMINQQSTLKGVSCNPIAQASHLNSQQVNLTITLGLCLGHDIIFNKYIQSFQTNIVVKDRLFNHNPLAAIKQLKAIK